MYRYILPLFLFFLPPVAAVDVTFIALHPNPGQHFASLAQVLRSNGLQVQIYASEKAFEALVNQNIDAIDFHPSGPLIQRLDLSEQQQLIQQLLSCCTNSRHVVTDIGEDFFILLHQAFEKDYSGCRWAYYDNPQPYVNPTYSRIAGSIAKTNPLFLYASANLAMGDIYDQDHHPIKVNAAGIGFFPMEDVVKLKNMRKDRHTILQKLPENIRGKHLFAYIGAANSDYYTKTFPHIIKILAESQGQLGDSMILLQQHPRALQEGDLDRLLVDAHNHLPIMCSPLTTMEGAAISEIVFYSDTTFAMRAELASIPVGKIDENSTKESFINTLTDHNLPPSTPEELVGYRENWKETLLHIFYR